MRTLKYGGLDGILHTIGPYIPIVRRRPEQDFLASVVAFLVALPCAWALPSHRAEPPASGIITGIVGGLVVGWIAGCPLQVSGPAAGLTVIILDLVQTHGREHVGIIILWPARSKSEQPGFNSGTGFGRYRPPSSTACWQESEQSSFVGQFHIMIDDAPKGSGLANLLTLPEALWKSMLTGNDADTSHHEAARIGLLTIAAIILWTKCAPKRLRLLPPVLARRGMRHRSFCHQSGADQPCGRPG